MQTRREVSAGGVVYRRREGRAEIALASRRNRKGELAWGLPKGMIEKEEAPEVTAVREVLEETGLEAEIEAPLGEITYFYVWEGVRVHKIVHFFLMRATGGDIGNHDFEMEEVRWFDLEELPRAASYKTERDVIARAIERLS